MVPENTAFYGAIIDLASEDTRRLRRGYFGMVGGSNQLVVTLLIAWTVSLAEYLMMIIIHFCVRRRICTL